MLMENHSSAHYINKMCWKHIYHNNQWKISLRVCCKLEKERVISRVTHSLFVSTFSHWLLQHKKLYFQKSDAQDSCKISYMHLHAIYEYAINIAVLVNLLLLCGDGHLSLLCCTAIQSAHTVVLGGHAKKPCTSLSMYFASHLSEKAFHCSLWPRTLLMATQKASLY